MDISIISISTNSHSNLHKKKRKLKALYRFVKWEELFCVHLVPDVKIPFIFPIDNSTKV